MTNQSLNISFPPYPWGDAKPWCHHPVLDWSKFAGTQQDKVSICTARHYRVMAFQEHLQIASI